MKDYWLRTRLIYTAEFGPNTFATTRAAGAVLGHVYPKFGGSPDIKRGLGSSSHRVTALYTLMGYQGQTWNVTKASDRDVTSEADYEVPPRHGVPLRLEREFPTTNVSENIPL
ncbi:hypothetical protein J6590_060468 [Homalodisca vitripennis]|nr:hypothetical protein J6590_060468 [Homalodisca vitripennis]